MNYETLLERSDKNIEMLYPLLEFCYLNYASLIRSSSLLFKFLQLFVDELNNQNKVVQARKFLTEYLKSDVLIESKKQFLDSLENKEKYQLLSDVQKNMLYEIIKDCLDTTAFFKSSASFILWPYFFLPKAHSLYFSSSNLKSLQR